MEPIDNSNFALSSLGLGAPTRTPTNELGQTEFLQLMITQFQNQDPFKPLESGEFLGQLAQFGTVNGVQELQSSFSELANALQSNQALMASSLVGRSVLVPGSYGVLAEGSPLSGAFELADPTSNTVLEIYSTNGELMRRMELGQMPAGQTKFEWDGLDDKGSRLAPGVYQVKVSAHVGGAVTAAQIHVAAKVESVTLGGQSGLILNLERIGSVPFTDVKQVS